MVHKSMCRVSAICVLYREFNLITYLGGISYYCILLVLLLKNNSAVSISGLFFFAICEMFFIDKDMEADCEIFLEHQFVFS